MTTATEDRLAEPLAATKKKAASPAPKRPRLVGLDEHKRAIKAAMESNANALLIGGASTGKSTLAQECAYELGRRWYRVNLNGYVTPDQLIGRMQAKANNGTDTYFQYGILARAMREGAVMILDEVNAALADTLFCLHAVLERNPRLYVPETEEEITPKEGFCIIGTMNPSHEYAGTRELNAAFYSRFAVVRRFEELKGAQLFEALRMHAPASVEDKSILAVSKILEDIRETRSKDRITTLITLRDCISALELMTRLPENEAIQSAIWQKLDERERIEVPTSPAPTLPAGISLTDMIEASKKLSECEAALTKANAELAAMGKLREVLSAFTAAGGTK